jgi:hypothetical protein
MKKNIAKRQKSSNCPQNIDESYSVPFQTRQVAISIFIEQRHKTDQILESTMSKLQCRTILNAGKVIFENPWYQVDVKK